LIGASQSEPSWYRDSYSRDTRKLRRDSTPIKNRGPVYRERRKMTQIEQAIDDSIMQDRIVDVEATPANLDELRAECDDDCDGTGGDYWGDRDGSAWRISAR
jgi:hypothetical protein